MQSPLLEESAGKRAVLAASTGGHLAQLHRIAPNLGLSQPPLWITFDNAQSRALLADENVLFVPYIAPRDYRNLTRALRPIGRALKRSDYDVAISTGAALAAAVLPLAKVGGKEAIYIESVSRFNGPSLTGKIMSLCPGIVTVTQHESWASSKWPYRFSVLDEYAASAVPSPSIKELKVFVTLGTIRPYRFDALVDALLAVLPPSASVVWQLGETDRHGLPGESFRSLTSEQFDSNVQWADVVVTHAGVGSAMRILELGKAPYMVPRRMSRGEHVDDHQLQIMNYLQGRHLAICSEAEEISVEGMIKAASLAVSTSSSIGTGER
ncbi:glycosyltransferase [Arthrobacter sunyaminii]|uniref:Glycosyl transferase family 28 C-terminal domain-containing protein n=1 Tax=Arthrobacter sunyaminii TaxID=2816859 RepID=A0A975S7B6_9MICC|nr:glycosyltransferase [Arthrobacter sunyaminii]MBO0908159.1 hypothetical protein [Arthrobacter sunyaminii]QWQ37167.1 hypothetical protein KG104_05215 [Arthrobacter sunyaminii]